MKGTTGGEILFPLIFSKWYLWVLGYTWYDNWIACPVVLENNPLGAVTTYGRLASLPLHIVLIGV